MNCWNIGKNLALNGCTASRAGIYDEIVIMNHEDVNKSHSVLSDNVVSEIMMRSSKAAYRYVSARNAFEGSSTLQKGTYANLFDHQVVGRVFLRTQEAKDEMNSLSGGRVLVIAKGLDRNTKETMYEVYGWDSGLVMSDFQQESTDTDGVLYTFTLASDDNEKESRPPLSLWAGSLEDTEEMIEGLLTPQVERHTFTITASPEGAKVVINGEETDSVTVDYGTEVEWSVECENYVTQTGKETVTRDITRAVTLELVKVTFSIAPTPDTAKVTIDGEERKSVTVEYGTEVAWEVSAEHYTTQSGTEVVTGDTTKAVTLELQTYTFTVQPTPADATVVINGEQRTSIEAPYGTEVEWEVSAEGYVSQSGSQVVTEDATKDVELKKEASCVYVAYIDTNGANRIIDPSEWDGSLGTAVGVLVADKEHSVLIAPTEAESTMQWGMYGTLIDGVTTTTASSEASEDYGGKANTAACVAAGIGESYATGWCNAYSYGGIGAGEWWLPACGDLYNLIYPHISDINEALTTIGGTALSTSSYYWSSTQCSSNNAWNVDMSNGGRIYTSKNYNYHVRAVSAFDYEV